jgi:hypothetical protein
MSNLVQYASAPNAMGLGHFARQVGVRELHAMTGLFGIAAP